MAHVYPVEIIGIMLCGKNNLNPFSFHDDPADGLARILEGSEQAKSRLFKLVVGHGHSPFEPRSAVAVRMNKLMIQSKPIAVTLHVQFARRFRTNGKPMQTVLRFKL
ncbi:MAG: hypothetical protein CMN18_07965 [Roseovarius sp.]|nr:hypothetical protein [Roseovarius sp.]MBD12636.1 hypothetical protein [Roseovarius sp.]|tara:strand:+ start:283 stop:603 length:321 start_codon:yes stop_codon:yes gene_type:complete